MPILTSVEQTQSSNRTFGAQLWGLFRTMRPKQWTKNAFIFVALLFDGKVLDPEYLLVTIAGFALLCLTASSVYLFNDLSDIEADRQHPKKRNRALPSGQLSKGVALSAAILFPVIAIPLGLWLDPIFGVILIGYLGLQVAYTFRLKHIVLLDVLAIAAGFVLRVGAGVALVDVERFSPWLYIFTTMLALFLGFAKRRQELVLLDGKNGTRAILEEYNIDLLDQLLMIVTATTIMTYALYTFSAEGLPENHLMMLTVPFVIYGIFRYLYLIHVKKITETPDEVLLKDIPMLASVVTWALSVFLVLYII